MSTDHQTALILLRTGLALPKDSPVGPFFQKEWQKAGIGVALERMGWREGKLLGMAAADIARELALPPDVTERIAFLASRGGQLALERDRLQSRGIWVLTAYDADYPQTLLRRLDSSAPPVLFGAGSKEVLARRGIAIVGSRDVDDAGLAFAGELGRSCVAAGLTVYSGGARGVDQVAMRAALDAGGSTVGVLAEGVERSIRTKDNVKSLLAGTLALLSPYLPKAGFTVSNAMARNRIVYALAEAAVVVASSEGSGGTWAGAKENLNARWVPLYVRTGPGVPPGNRALVAEGARPLEDEAVAALLTGISRSGDGRGRRDEPSQQVRDVDQVTAAAPALGGIEDGATSESDGRLDLFCVNWPLLAQRLTRPMTAQQLGAEVTGVEPAQLKRWLEMAEERGLASAQGRPKRYRVVAIRQPAIDQAQLSFGF